MPRRRRPEALSPAEAAELIRRALHLRDSIIHGLASISPYAAHYHALAEARESLDNALAAISGQELDYRLPNLGIRLD